MLIVILERSLHETIRISFNVVRSLNILRKIRSFALLKNGSDFKWLISKILAN